MRHAEFTVVQITIAGVQFLFSKRNCTACHTSPREPQQTLTTRPEQSRRNTPDSTQQQAAPGGEPGARGRAPR
uniref:hypothetical protein n=1 Tax=Nocardia carnea TaxID=37328 RepID=UPI0024566115